MIESLIELNHLRIILAIGMLGYASFTDVTKREISDYLWIVFGASAAILLIFEPNLSESLITIGISLIVAPVAIIIWRIGLFDGFEEPTRKRIMAMFLGYRAQNPKFGFSIEKKVGKHKKLNLVLHHAEYAEFCHTPNTWITPGIPYMLFITGGLIIQLMYGDVIFRFLESI